MTALLQVQSYGQLPECRRSINTQASQLAGAGGVACGYHVIDHGYARTYSVVLVVQGFGGMCWIVLVVAVSIPEYTCHCGCRCRCCHVVVAVILVDSSLVIINDCQCFHI